MRLFTHSLPISLKLRIIMTMSKSVCTLPFNYDNTSERRVLNLEYDGLPCVPALGYSHYKSCRPSVSEHIHPGCLEMTLCMRGSLVFECGGKALRLLPGNVFVTQPDEPHRLSTNPKGLVMFWIFFRFGPTSRSILRLPTAESDALWQNLRTLPPTPFKASDRLRHAFQRLFKLCDELPAGPFRSLALRGTVLDLMLALIEVAKIPSESIPGSDRIVALIETMRRHPEQQYSVDEMAHQTALSPSQLITRFKQLTGYPPYNFLLACRMRTALERLRESSLTITVIAQSLGFSSSQHFAMQFKREFGITPSAWRAGQVTVIHDPY